MTRNLLFAAPLLLLIVAATALAQGDAPPEEPVTTAPAEAPRDEIPLWPEVLEPLVLDEVPAPFPSLSAQVCNACHGEVHDEWATSGHATAATNPVYLAATEALGDPFVCHECHMPLQVQRPVIPRGPSAKGAGRAENPAYQPSLRLEGVTCAACHVRADGIVGPRELAPNQAPHPVRASRAMSGPEACAYCHQVALPGAEDQPFLDTVGEWSRSAFGEAEITCQQCHMPRVSGVIAGSRYAAYSAHRWTEGRAPSHLARALTLLVDLRSTSLQRGEALRASATLMNTGAGHSVPTGDPSHRLELHFTVQDHEGKLPKGAEAHSEWFGREVEPEPPFAELKDDRLMAGGSRTVDYAYSADKKSKPGTYHLVVTTRWWSVSPEQAEAIGLAAEDVQIDLSVQRIPFEVN
jgi:hypothetical protein